MPMSLELGFSVAAVCWAPGEESIVICMSFIGCNGVNRSEYLPYADVLASMKYSKLQRPSSLALTKSRGTRDAHKPAIIERS
jgi:hypothetical protein